MASTESRSQRAQLRFCKAFFEVRDAVSTHERLLAVGAQELDGGNAGEAGDASDRWYWWQEPPTGEGVPQASFLLRMRGRRLVVEGPTAVSLGRGWRALDEHLRPHARARVAAGDDLARFLPRPRPHSADRPESWSREHEQRVLREFYAAFCDRWARQPHPRLDGLSPLEASMRPESARGGI